MNAQAVLQFVPFADMTTEHMMNMAKNVTQNAVSTLTLAGQGYEALAITMNEYLSQIDKHLEYDTATSTLALPLLAGLAFVGLYAIIYWILFGGGQKTPASEQ